jgi:hypothetical protein
MDINQAMQEIISQCESMDSFIVKLRVHSVFDSEQYQRFIDALLVYEQAISGDALIDRRIAGCLFIDNEVLGSMAHYYNQHGLEEVVKVRNAHAEVWSLIEKIFAWPKETLDEAP